MHRSVVFLKYANIQHFQFVFLSTLFSIDTLFFQGLGEHIHKELQLRRQPSDELETEQLRQLPPLQVAYEQVKDGLLEGPELQPLRRLLRALNGEQVVVVVWQFVGNLKC